MSEDYDYDEYREHKSEEKQEKQRRDKRSFNGKRKSFRDKGRKDFSDRKNRRDYYD